MQKKIVIFASGQGTNAENIIKRFKGDDIIVKAIVTNNANAGVIDVAKRFGIPHHIVNKKIFLNSEELLKVLDIYNPDLIVLAGFLWLIPPFLVNKYKNRIINIHPALLPRYGGKGMYGMKVHRAVKEAGDLKSGITIHFVNENYDEGSIIFQKEVAIDKMDTPEDIANKIHALEYRYFPIVIKDLLISK